MNWILKTARGTIRLPTFFPVTTFGGRFPLDRLLQPFLGRFSEGILVSHFCAQKIIDQQLPVFIDSGGFAGLFKGSRMFHLPDGTHGIQTREGSPITPESVLRFQEQHADIAAPLDFIITPDTSPADADHHQKWTLSNAEWALTHRKRQDLLLFGSLQAWDRDSMHRMMDVLQPLPFGGFALGGIVPRVRTPKLIFELVAAFRKREPDRPLHLFGPGSPRLVKALFAYGVSSVDSSNYVRQAVNKRYLLPNTGEYVQIDDHLDPSDTCPCCVCRQFSRDYLLLQHADRPDRALDLKRVRIWPSCFGGNSGRRHRRSLWPFISTGGIDCWAKN